MHAELQRIYEPAFCLRLWHDSRCGYGDPYQWAATARLIDDDSLEVMGVTAAPTGDELRAILTAAALLGCYRAGATRIKHDRTFMRWHRTSLHFHQHISRP